MFYKYEIKVEDTEEILYLYVDDKYEFAKEIMNNSNHDDLTSKINKYINDMKIKFKGTKILLVVGGIVIALISTSGIIATNKNNSNTNLSETIVKKVEIKEEVSENDYFNLDEIVTNNKKQELNSTNDKTEVHSVDKKQNVELEKEQPVNKSPIEKEEPVKKESVKEEILKSEPLKEDILKEEIVENKTMLTLYRSSGVVQQIDLEEYLVGVVGGEMPASFNAEALKAQAVVARTYALKRMSEGKVLTDNVSTQVYRDIDQLKNNWGSSFDYYYNKVKNAVVSTKGEYITYNNKYIDAVYHSTSNGYTEDAIYVWGYTIPYLKSVNSPWDVTATPYLRTVEKTNNDILKVLGIEINDDTPVEVLEKSSSNRINKVKIGDNIYEGIELYNKLGLRSRDFDLIITDIGCSIVTRGYGHGVGMSQYGANGMANNGYNYKQIIHHYYSNVQILS
ncbi:MAG: stage II sporulation protein D [Bacilli bacterium]|nr:stage II sporulation protein D [Bacilli bacterium]MDD4808897.1 stage II sporulation protein D [Bacilli bacterium]